jgi:DNA-binding HxlR family transcriptional regulator
MRRKSFQDMNCSVAQTLEVVGEWWTMLILRDCFLGVRRFDDFHKRLGISRNILSERLEHLVSRGVLDRVAYQQNPIRHEYRLTDKGRDLWGVLTVMRQWGDRWETVGELPLLMEHRGCNHETTALLTCSECGEPLDCRSVAVRPGSGDQALIRPPAAVVAGADRSSR